MNKPTEKQTRSRVTTAALAAGSRKPSGAASSAKPAGGRAQKVVALPLGRAEDGSSTGAAGVWFRTDPRASSSG